MNVARQSPVNKGPKQQPDGPLNVFSAQPAPLLLHQQTQDVQSHLRQRRLRCCAHNMQDTQNNTTHCDILQDNYCVTGQDQIQHSKYTALCVGLAYKRSIWQTDGSVEGHVWITETKHYNLFQRNTLPACASDEHAGPVVTSALHFIHLLTLPSCG